MNDNLMDTIKGLLNDPEALRSVSELLMGGSGANPSEAESQGAQQVETMSKLKSALDRFNSGDDPRINLLNALKPYMRAARTDHVDRAIRMMQMTKMISILKDMK